MELREHTALVTGGASGLGEATVRMFLAARARVVILDTDRERGESLASTLGQSVMFVSANVSDADQVQQAIDQTVHTFGSLHVVVNCAGIATPGRILSPFGPLPLEKFTQVIEVNLVGTFNVMRLAAAAMRANEPDEGGERGVIINTTSIAAYEGQVGQAAYAAAKAGIAGLTLPAARDLAQWGIRVVTIAPGLFNTPLLAGLPQQTRQDLAAQIPFPPRLGQPQEYAHLVSHIVANRMLNGEVIRLDGALRMGPR